MRIVSFLSGVVLLTAMAASWAHGEVVTYPGPAEQFRSAEYRVSVTQDGRTAESFVYAHEHQDAALRDHMTDFNHWTTFSFTGKIIVEVTRLREPISTATILPRARGISAALAGRSVRFELDAPAKLWVKLDGAEEHPLFIFADPPEENIPSRTDPNVIWFEPGKVHDIGERFAIKSGQTVYIPGGAYVKGTITAESASHVTIRGRGILSGLGYARRPSVAGIPFNTVMFSGPGDDQLVEGITVTNPQHFCLLSRGRLVARNVKLFGWWHQTDGWGGGDGSVIEDSFLKVNDDSVKLYGRDQIARRLVIYQQYNGAPFQLGWGGAGQCARNCLVEDIDLIACEAATKTQREANQAFLNLRNQSAESVIDGVTLRRIRIDCDIAMLVGFTQVKGVVRNVAFDAVDVRGKVNGANFVRTESVGRVEGIRFNGLRVGGEAAPSATGFRWSTTGQVTPAVVGP